MLRRFNVNLQSMAVAAILLTFVSAIAWSAKKTDDDTDANSAVNYYSNHATVEKAGEEVTITLVHHRGDMVQAVIEAGALDAYMTQQEINSVEITIELVETRFEVSGGETYYTLDFVFGPSGAFFQPALKLKIRGKYTSDSNEIWLYDEQGEALEVVSANSKNMKIFKINHFSRYSYDLYDY